MNYKITVSLRDGLDCLLHFASDVTSSINIATVIRPSDMFGCCITTGNMLKKFSVWNNFTISKDANVNVTAT